MYNYLLPVSPWHLPELATEGLLVHAHGEGAAMPQSDPVDVGKFAAAALLEEPERFNLEEIELRNENYRREGGVSKVYYRRCSVDWSSAQ